jgi:hypothetical protein
MKSERILRGHLLPASHSAEIEDEDGKGRWKCMEGRVGKGGSSKPFRPLVFKPD